MRLLVCGGRRYDDADGMAWELSRYAMRWETLEIIVGYDPDNKNFQGADELAFRWAEEHGIPVFPFRAPWATKGRAAGPIRNGWMLRYGKPDRVLAFPGGNGTADMISKARAAGVLVFDLEVL